MRRVFLCLSLVTVAVLVAGGQTASRRATAENLFREALATERAEGDLQAAIFRYERLIADFSSERTIAAQAMFQLAQAYLKLGDSRGPLLLARLTREYSDVEPYAGRARARLTALQNAPPGPFRRVSVDQDGSFGSPDGTLIAYHKDSKGSVLVVPTNPLDLSRLYVKNLSTGTERLLIEHAGQSISNLAWSPDSRQLAFNLYGAGVHDVRVVDLAKGSETSLGTRGYPLDWAGPGNILVYLPNYAAGQIDYSLVPAAGGTPRKLPSSADCCPVITPDGARLVTRKSKRYVVIDIATGKEQPLTAFTGEEIDATLSPDGRLVSFAANQQGRWAFYVAPFGGALPVKQPIKIDDLEQPPWTGTRWHLRQWWTQKGLLTFQLTTSPSDIYRVDVDPSTGRTTSEPVRLTQDATENFLPSVSPDNRRVAYNYRNGPRGGIAVMDSSGANERPLFEESSVQWQSAEEILVKRPGAKEGEKPSFQSSNLSTGASKPVAGAAGVYWRFAPGRNEILHAYPGAGGPRPGATLKATSIADGKERIVATIDYLAPNFAISQDGKRVAYSTYRTGKTPADTVCRLAVIPIEGGPETVLVPDHAKATVPLAWSPDGRFLLYHLEGDGLRMLNVQTRESWPLIPEQAATTTRLQRGSWSPDGTFIVFEKAGETKTIQLAWDGLTAEAVARIAAQK